jgi:hypothetical protein
MRILRYGSEFEKSREDFYASYDPPGWFVTQARLLAYAAQEVRDAFDASFEAEVEVRMRYEEWKYKTDRAKGPEIHAAMEAVAMEAVESAMEDARAKDDALLAAIRAELHSRPSKELIPRRPGSPDASAPGE